MICVGAAFDFHSGERRWAPKVIRDLGLEWLMRLAQEPRRVGPKALDGARIVVASFLQRAARNYDGLAPNAPVFPRLSVKSGLRTMESTKE